MLKSKVVIGYCDVAGAGCRALLGANMEKFDVIPVVFSNKFPLEANEPTLLQFNHKFQDISLVVINAEMEPHLVHLCAAEIIDIIRKSDVEDVTILSAIPLNLGEKFYKLIDKGKETDFASGCAVTDPMLNHLLQFSKIEKFNITLVAVDGKKARFNSIPNNNDGSEQNIRQFYQFLFTEVSKDFDLGKSLSLVINRPLWKSDRDLDLMYL